MSFWGCLPQILMLSSVPHCYLQLGYPPGPPSPAAVQRQAHPRGEGSQLQQLHRLKPDHIWIIAHSESLKINITSKLMVYSQFRDEHAGLGSLSGTTLLYSEPASYRKRCHIKFSTRKMTEYLILLDVVLKYSQGSNRYEFLNVRPSGMSSKNTITFYLLI